MQKKKQCVPSLVNMQAHDFASVRVAFQYSLINIYIKIQCMFNTSDPSNDKILLFENNKR